MAGADAESERQAIMRLLEKMSDHERRQGNMEAMYALNRAWHAIDKRQHYGYANPETKP